MLAVLEGFTIIAVGVGVPLILAAYGSCPSKPSSSSAMSSREASSSCQ